MSAATSEAIPNRKSNLHSSSGKAFLKRVIAFGRNIAPRTRMSEMRTIEAPPAIVRARAFPMSSSSIARSTCLRYSSPAGVRRTPRAVRSNSLISVRASSCDIA